MKKIISAMLAACLVVLLLPIATVNAEGADLGGAENCLQYSVIMNDETEEFSSKTTAVLFQVNGANFVITSNQSAGDETMMFTIAGDTTTVYGAAYAAPFADGLHLYTARDDFGEAQGFIPAGGVQRGEQVTVLYMNSDDEPTTVLTEAGDVGDGILKLPNLEGKLNRVAAVLNSRNELCAVYYNQEAVAYTVLSDEGGNGGSSGSQDAGGSEGSGSSNKAAACLQGAWYYNENTYEYGQWSSAILMSNGTDVFMVTALEPREDLVTVYSVETNDSDWYASYNTWLADGVYLYNANPEFGEAEGFCMVGPVQPGETLTLVLWESEHSRKIVQATADAMVDEWVLTLDGVSVNADYLIPVLNSNNELCAIYDPTENCAISMLTDEDAFYGRSTPDETEPGGQGPAETQPADSQGSGGQGTAVQEKYEYPVDLADLDDLHENALLQKQPDNSGYIIVGIIIAAAVVLAVVVVLVVRKKKDAQPELDDAEDGTELADVPVETGLSLQFRSGSRIAVTGRLTIGRATDNSVVISQTSNVVSGRHCEILVQNGAVYLRDLGSTNGTYINGKRLVSGQLVQLLPGMMVGLGAPKGNDMFAVMNSAQ